MIQVNIQLASVKKHVVYGKLLYTTEGQQATCR